MESASLTLSREEIIGHLEAATAQHLQAARSLGVRLNGRPTKYRPEYAEFAYSMLIDVRTVATISYVAAGRFGTKAVGAAFGLRGRTDLLQRNSIWNRSFFATI